MNSKKRKRVVSAGEEGVGVVRYVVLGPRESQFGPRESQWLTFPELITYWPWLTDTDRDTIRLLAPGQRWRRPPSNNSSFDAWYSVSVTRERVEDVNRKRAETLLYLTRAKRLIQNMKSEIEYAEKAILESDSVHVKDFVDSWEYKENG
jgi:hypothetical protein